MSEPRGKDRVEAHFSAQAEAYEGNVVPRFEPLAQRLVELAGLSAGQRVLDVASGTGLAAFLAARAVGPTGHVLATDFSAGMLDVARQKAARLGLSNVSFAQMDAEAIDLPEASQDAALCALGLFLLRQAPKAAADIRRVLVPGGRFSCSVWGAPEAHEPFVIFYGEYAKYDAKISGPGMGRPGVLERLLREAGFAHVRIRREMGRQLFPDPEAFWQFFMSVGGPSAMVARLPAEQQAAFQADVLRSLATRSGPRGLELRTEIVYGTGVRGG